MADPEVVRNDAESRYELIIDGALAQIVFDQRGDRLELIHTEVPEALNGRGIGGRLAQFALDDARNRGLTVVPYCPFVRSWLERHPDFEKRQPIEWPN